MFPLDITSRGSFKRQIILTYVVGFFILITAFAAYLIASESNNLHRDNLDETAGLARSLAISSLPWVLASDVEGLQEAVLSFRAYPKLHYAMIISPSGRVLAHSDAAKVGQFLTDEQSLALIKAPPGSRIMIDSQSVTDVAVPIEMDKRHVGWARIGLGQEENAGNFRQMLWGSTIFVLLATALSLLAAMLIANRLGARIDSLVKVAGEVQAGNFATRANIPGDEDEIAKLANSQNKMLDALSQNEQKLRAASLYTRSLIEASLDPLVTISPEGKITDVNQATEKATGKNRAELIGTDFSDYFTEPDKAKVGYQQVFTQGFVTDYPLALRHRDGHITDVLYNASVYRDEAGKVLGVFAAARDITERNKAGTALRESEALFQAVLKILPVGLWVADATGQLVFGNDKGRQIWAGEKFIGIEQYGEYKGWRLDSGKPLGPHDWGMARAIEKGEISIEEEIEIECFDGTRKIIFNSALPLRSNDGSISGAIGINQDITERKALENQLRQSFAYNRSLIEASLDPLVTISAEGKITDVNQATEKITGRNRSELIGTDFSDYFANPDKARAGYQQVFAQGFVTDYPLALRHRDGHVTDVLYNASLYRNKAGEVLGVFAAARDVTERNRAEDALRNSENRYRLLVESAPMCIHEIGMDGRIVSMNRAGLEMMGVAEECKIQGFLYLDAVCDADRERIGKLLDSAYAGEASYFEFKASGPGGLIFKSCFVPLKNQNGDVAKLMGITEDITERKRSENELREKEERLALATVNNGVGIWDWNLQTQEMIWDDSMYALYHIRREDFSGTEEAWRTALHPDDLERGDREVTDAISGVKPFNTEFRVIWPNGEIHHIKAVAKVFRDNQGTPLRMLGINMDITDRKQAEDALREREKFLSLIIENIPDMIFMKDAVELRFVRFNKAGEELLGYNREELLGKNDYDFFPREQADFFTTKDREVLEGKQLYDIPEEPLDSKTGKHILHTKKLPILDANGKPAYLLGISEDITERKKAENEIRDLNRDLERRVQERTEELRESEERFRSVASNTPDHLIAQDRELRYTLVINPQLGLTEQDMLGKTDYDFLSREEADKLTKVKRQVLDTGMSVHFETSLIALSSEEEFFDGTYVPKFNANGDVAGLIGYFKNVTERKRSEDNIRHLNDELRQHAKALEAANKELEAFSYSVSHDLRTPLRAIDGFSHILLDDYAGKLDDEGKRLLNVVRDNAGKMGQLIDDILKFSRAGRLEITFSEIDMGRMAHEVYEELRPAAGHEVRVEIGHIPPAMGDRAMMRQVFVNLLSNAIKFTRAREDAQIEVGSSSGENETVYFVKDNGAGFDMQYVDRLFGVFQRLHTVNEFEGTGIGLAIVKRIITRHGGRVWAEGKVNGGATIYFALPAKETAQG